MSLMCLCLSCQNESHNPTFKKGNFSYLSLSNESKYMQGCNFTLLSFFRTTCIVQFYKIFFFFCQFFVNKNCDYNYIDRVLLQSRNHQSQLICLYVWKCTIEICFRIKTHSLNYFTFLLNFKKI